MKNLIWVLIILVLSGVCIYKEYRQPIVIETEVCPIPNEYIGEFDTTFYTHTGNKCSTGVYPKTNRTVAVDPKIIPYGTMIYVENYGFYIAEDCGLHVKNKRLDIFLDSKEECIKQGRKTLKVWVLTNK